MELRHLRYFVGVGEEQHFGRAALRLRIAQPALSRQIQALERELGFALFERLPRGARLSAAGQLFLSDARRILRDIDDARLRAERIAQGRTGTLRIGIATAVSWHGVLATAFRRFRADRPDAELVLHHELSPHQIQAVTTGRLDAGFAAGLIPLEKQVAHWECARDRMVLAVPKGHALTKRRNVRLRDLRGLPFVWFSRWVNPVFYDQMMAACARGGLSSPRIVQEAPDRDTNLGLVQCRVGVSWQTEALRWHCPKGVVPVPVVDMNVRLPFNLVWRHDNTSPLLKRFVEITMHSAT